MLLGKLASSILGSALTGRGLIRGGEGTIRAGENLLTNSEIECKHTIQ